ncbi:hypothetical protein H4R18_001319 [Coemansia javaensis]|uniref:Uncharacterized protein n=1 Tax=Coemansia javaensis TaxID=2761396 RepID=A0A9W8HLV5_9FUNG|nr:hypothetical protein H4R18_001319 [Coemansia javaensis]
MEPATEQHAPAHGAPAPLVAPPGPPDAADGGAERALAHRFRSLSMSTRERPAWTEETVRRKYPADKTVELYGFSSDFETADLNQMLIPYQHHQSDRGGYRIKWLNDTRALAVFRRAETARRVLSDLGASSLVQTRFYVFSPGDLSEFNRKSGDDAARPGAAAASAAPAANASEPASPHPGFDEEHIRYKYRPEVTIELHDFPCPLETADLQQQLDKYKHSDSIVRIKWFNRNRALAWFTSPQVAAEALEGLRTCELLHAKPYVFAPADMKYFGPEPRPADAAAGGLTRRRTIGSGGLARRNTVSGAPHYHRAGHMYAPPAAAIPLVPSGFAAAASSNFNSNDGAASPQFPPRRQRRFTRADA